ncbi:helix-turn-helix transcriptional regulator [Caulobacter sp. 73W]|uniref:Helix-turn-helix transcriptional regulator n=1 Tax=Caulobacter sp. 73W TaxID=3161137 RepID=A0AB39KW75_9CAUL
MSYQAPSVMQSKKSKRYSFEPLTGAIRRERQSKGWSQRDLSARTHLTQAQISRIENGEVDLQLSTLLELARSLDLDLHLVPRSALTAVGAAVRSTEEQTRERSYRTLLANLRRLAEEAQTSAPGREDIASIASSLQELEPLTSHLSGPFMTADLKRLQIDLERFLQSAPAERPGQTRAFGKAAAWLKTLRNTAAHLPHSERPAYSLDDED